jgi:pimeloyl-ACP methyl ester carboxylesterase
MLAAVLTGAASAQTDSSATQRNERVARTFSEFLNRGPHRAFAVSPAGDHSAFWAGARDIERAVAGALQACAAAAKGAACTLQVVNNYTVTNLDWRTAVPERSADSPDFGRLRPQPYWSMRGPQLAAGLLVWIHGYASDKVSTETAPQQWTGRFLRDGYDLYRFDREWISDWASDATALASAVASARAAGYRRVVLAGQSAGAWVALAALHRGAKVDGVVSIAAAHHGLVDKMVDKERAAAEWRYVVEGLKPGPRILIVNFPDDPYDVGGRTDAARAAFAASHVESVVIDAPPDFKGHLGGLGGAFAVKFGGCIRAFIVSGQRQAPCVPAAAAQEPAPRSE